MDTNPVPIGIVKSSVTGLKKVSKDNWETTISEIIINDDLEEALDQIESFSHIIVIYWMHQISPSQRMLMKVHPKGNKNLPLVGVIATRSPSRPNPIGITTVRLLERSGNVLKVIGLDAVDGTPILDLKPYIPGYDCPSDAKTPGWIKPE